MMNRTILTVLFGAAILSARSPAQNSESWTAAVRGTMLIPAGSLSELFRPGGGFAFAVGQRTSSDMIWEGVVEVARFTRPNADRLYHDSLSLGLDWVGAGVQATYHPFGGEGTLGGTVHPYLVGSALMTRWTYDRGALSADTIGSVVLTPFRQQDWSLSLALGVGAEAYVTEHLSLYGAASYRLVIGEIWPTLALRVEGASGFQLVEASAGLRVWF